MTDMPRALTIMNALAAMATARLGGDTAGEQLLLDEVSEQDRQLFTQAAAVMLARVREEEQPVPPTAEAARLHRAAILVGSGDTPAAWRVLVDNPPLSVDVTVQTLADAWLERFADVELAIAHGRAVCTAYRAAALQL